MGAVRPLAALAGLVLAAGLALAAADRGEVVEPTPLLGRPDEGSNVLARLDAGTIVERGERRNGWLGAAPVEGETGRGWVRVWKVRDAEQGGIAAALKRFSRKVAGFFSDQQEVPRTDQAKVTATVGVRGLGGDRIDRATPAPQAVERVRRQRVGAAQARAFAREAGLTERPGIQTPGAGVSAAEDWGGW